MPTPTPAEQATELLNHIEATHYGDLDLHNGKCDCVQRILAIRTQAGREAVEGIEKVLASYGAKEPKKTTKRQLLTHTIWTAQVTTMRRCVTWLRTHFALPSEREG